MQLFYFLALVAVLGAAYAQPVGEDQAKEAAFVTRLEDVADLGDAQPQEGNGDRPTRWLWGGLGGINSGWGGISNGWGGGWSPGWGGGGWGSGLRVSYRPWSSGSSYWW